MAETTEQYRNRINQLKTSIENEPYMKNMRPDIAEGISKTGNRQADIEEQFQEVIDNTTGKDVISAPELIAARNGESDLKARLDKEQQQVNAQLAQTNEHIARTVNTLPSSFSRLGDVDVILTAIKNAIDSGSVVKVAYAGDSITGSGNYLDISDRWVEQSQKMLMLKYPDVSFEFKNFGIGGLTLQNFANPEYIPDSYYLNKWDVPLGTSWRDAVNSFTPDLLFVAYGMNPDSTLARQTSAQLYNMNIYFKQRSNPTIVLLSNMVPTKQFSTTWEERVVSSRHTRLFSAQENISLVDIFNRYRVLVDGVDEDRRIAVVKYKENFNLNGLGRFESDFKTVDFVIEFSTEFTETSRFELYSRTGDILFISANQIAFNTGNPVTLPNLIGTKRVRIEMSDKLVITIDDVVYYNRMYYGYQKEGSVSYKSNSDLTDFKFVVFNFAKTMNSLTNDDVYGNYVAEDYTTKYPYGGNGVNHPSSIGYNEIYMPPISEFIEKLQNQTVR